MNKQKRNWLLDAALLIGYLFCFFTDWTGVHWHQWLGIVLTAGCFYHLLLHWKWVVSITRRLFTGVNRQSRNYYLVDFTLLLGFLIILVSGLGISTWLNLSLESYPAWKNLHIYSSLISLGLLLLKIGLHRRWIVCTAQRHLGLWKPDRAQTGVGSQVLAANRPNLERREFIQLMGIISLGSLLSVSNLVDILQEESASPQGQNLTPLSPEDSDSISCQVVCDQGCTYPGQCRRYIDANGSGICDLTECSISSCASEEVLEEAVPPQVNTLEKTESCTVMCDRGCSYPGDCGQYLDSNENAFCDRGECQESNTAPLDSGSLSIGHGKGRRQRGN